MLTLIKSLVSGVAGGFISGLTGMGGGSLFVPIFFFFFDLPIKKAIATSLMVIVFSSLSGLVTHWRSRQVEGTLSLSIITGGIFGARLGAFFTAVLPDIVVKSFFITLVVITGLKMWQGSNRKENLAEDEKQSCPPVSIGKGVIVGLAGGIASGMGGVGGAIIIVPLLYLWVGIPMRICVGTVLTAVFFNAFSGCLGYWAERLIEVRTGFPVAMAALVAAPFGARLSMRLNPVRLRRIFAVVLIIGGLATFLKR
ncbi:MAG: sulfite exporter TauE/SafE family protein [Candidatus Omnitrophica bacterium]|nr:sulfite exporter TauE/SafE family protein [Candidatus Omnitrophota bacterium]